MAQWIRETTADHTSEVLKSMQRNGFRVSSRPRYGWVDDPDNPPKMVKDKNTGREYRIAGRTIKNPEEQGILGLMLRLHKEGITHYYITQRLNKEGYMNRVGNPWHHSTVKRIIAKNSVE